MNIFLSPQDAIIDLHERGFTHDFQLFGNDLLCVQEKTFDRMGAFSIVECHKFCYHPTLHRQTIVFGIIALHQNVKGILLNYYNRYTSKMPPVITKKTE